MFAICLQVGSAKVFYYGIHQIYPRQTYRERGRNISREAVNRKQQDGGPSLEGISPTRTPAP